MILNLEDPYRKLHGCLIERSCGRGTVLQAVMTLKESTFSEFPAAQVAHQNGLHNTLQQCLYCISGNRNEKEYQGRPYVPIGSHSTDAEASAAVRPPRLPRRYFDVYSEARSKLGGPH